MPMFLLSVVVVYEVYTIVPCKDVSHTPLAKMSFDEIFDLPAVVEECIFIFCNMPHY